MAPLKTTTLVNQPSSSLKNYLETINLNNRQIYLIQDFFLSPSAFKLSHGEPRTLEPHRVKPSAAWTVAPLIESARGCDIDNGLFKSELSSTPD